MNNITTTLLLAGGILLGLSSCDFDSNKPSGSLPPEEATSTLALLESATRGYYTLLETEPYGPCGQGSLYADAKGGDTKVIGKSNNFAPVANFNTDRNSGSATGTYSVYAATIGRVNEVLPVVDNVSDKDSDPDAYSQCVGEAYAMRAYAHLQLALCFCQMPTVAPDMDAQDSGIPIQSEAATTDKVQKRNTLRETYDFIVSDFEKALTLLPKKSMRDLNVYQLNYWAVEGLLARVSLYLGDYSTALKYAVDVIDHSGSELIGVSDYVSSWKEARGAESLFEISATDKSNAQRNSLGYQTNPAGYAEAAASDRFMDFVRSLPAGDVRKDMVTKRKSENDENEGYFTTKYMGRPGVASPLYVNNARVIRLSELYLIASEAALRGGTAAGTKSADYYYNELRAHRIAGYTPSAGVTLDNILDERRIEFFCENHRLFDLVRNKRDIHTTTVEGGVLKYDDYRVIMAIPEREINISKGTMVQNPNW